MSKGDGVFRPEMAFPEKGFDPGIPLQCPPVFLGYFQVSYRLFLIKMIYLLIIIISNREECNKFIKVLNENLDGELDLNQVIPQFTLNNICGKWDG